MVYIGVDLHRKKSQVVAIDQDGKLVLNRKRAPSRKLSRRRSVHTEPGAAETIAFLEDG